MKALSDLFPRIKTVPRDATITGVVARVNPSAQAFTLQTPEGESVIWYTLLPHSGLGMPQVGEEYTFTLHGRTTTVAQIKTKMLAALENVVADAALAKAVETQKAAVAERKRRMSQISRQDSHVV